MSLHIDSTRNSKSDTTSIKLLSCFLFKQSYPQIICNQCSQYDTVENQYGLANENQKFKLIHHPPRRLLYNRLKSGLSEWPLFSESDVVQPITLPNTSKITSDCSKISSSGSESNKYYICIYDLQY